MQPLLDIQNLTVCVEGEKILEDFSLTILQGQIHAIMGPNGAGKSTLAKVLSGHPSYEITSGSIVLRGEDILSLDPEERVHRGLFMSFQYPLEIPGLSNIDFLRSAYNSKQKFLGLSPLDISSFETLLKEKMEQMQIKEEFKTRGVNEGFSGGEKKRNEILQMLLLDPAVAILDETDSGLDIDAMRIVSEGVKKFHAENKALILITHYQRLLDYIRPDFVHVMMKGKIVLTKGADLALTLEEKGYDWIGK